MSRTTTDYATFLGSRLADHPHAVDAVTTLAYRYAPPAGTYYEWVSPNGVTHVARIGSGCVTCGNRHDLSGGTT